MLHEAARCAGRSAPLNPMAAASDSLLVVGGRMHPEPADREGRREPHALGVRA